MLKLVSLLLTLLYFRGDQKFLWDESSMLAVDELTEVSLASSRI